MMFSKKDQTFGDLFQAYIYRYKFLRVLELIDTYMLTVTATDFHDLHKSLLILTPLELHGGLIFVG